MKSPQYAQSQMLKVHALSGNTARWHAIRSFAPKALHYPDIAEVKER
jgi:hypothetical protein